MISTSPRSRDFQISTSLASKFYGSHFTFMVLTHFPLATSSCRQNFKSNHGKRSLRNRLHPTLAAARHETGSGLYR